MNKVGVIVQARMTSKRFPGKSVALLNKIPIIAHVVQGCVEIGDEIDHIVVAIPGNLVQQPIRAVVNRYFKAEPIVSVYADAVNDENDVLGRYHSIATELGLTHILRVTGDCPLIQPEPCQRVLDELLKPGVDYVSNCFPKRTLPRGLDCEGMSYGALSRAQLDVAAYSVNRFDSRFDREHVTPWIQRNFKIVNVVYDEDTSHMNLCVDYPTDIQRLESQMGTLQ